MPEGKLYNIGVDRRDAAEPVSAPNAKKSYPGIEVNNTILPILKGKQVGQEIVVLAKIKITGTSLPDDWDTIEIGNNVRFDILEIGEPAEQ